MASTYQRSLIKGIVWEGISFIITTLAIYIFYGDIITSLKFSVILTLIKMIFFFVHERAWKGVRWGKY
ncbi:hypothetical protein A3K73_04220 [Candidatus Pacearchaeota archaeon RBG_13_36_9]|nr:MAG: hypothetical protein A3K73_04220 [Candidatus Pacearchaeota archaeon RBG_13_36_9]